MPCYLAPATFSRFTSSYNKLHFEKTEIYNATLRPELGEQLQQLERRSESKRKEADADYVGPKKVSIIPSNRRSRKAYTVTVNFNEPEVPKEAPEEVLALLKLSVAKKIPVDKIKEVRRILCVVGVE